MPTSSPSINWFDAGGAAYAQFRPKYPPELAAFLATLVADHARAVDVGCGNGQLTTQLAAHFDAVTGIDPSADQIANATPHERVTYVCAPAEQLPLEDGATDLITVAQAAHWFDLPRFFAECRRIAAKGAAVALISYGVMRLDPDLQDRFMRFYADEVGPYWPPERKLVDRGYVDIAFPFDERRDRPDIAMRESWTLADLLGYVSTWSAVKRAKDAGREPLLAAFAADLAALWGAPDTKRTVAWPLALRLGTI